MIRLRTKGKCRLILGACFLYTLAIVFLLIRKPHIIRDVGYLTRPIWDNPFNAPEITIPHFQSDTVPIGKLCSLHGWKLRTLPTPKVIDAIIFSVELDLLEIRLKELWDVVDVFLVMEADRTFTGLEKPLTLKQNLDRFAWAKEKLVYTALENVLLSNPPSPMDNEIYMRRNIGKKVTSVGAAKGDLIIVSDTDEIPFRETIHLLKSCEGYASELHLQMRNYLYSFEFYVDTSNWKPHVAIYTPGRFRYYHGRLATSHHQLADAGWHCSFCFRYLSQFIFKMKAYSHTDRVSSLDLLKKENIQRKICVGADLFDMYPEAYTFKALFAGMGNVPRRQSTIGIPSYAVENSEKFKYLLPGGCIREDNNVS